MADVDRPIRIFVAIHLPAEVRAQLERLQRRLMGLAGGDLVRWTPVEQIHLTLRFLGDVGRDRLDELCDAVRRVCAGASPFRVYAGNLGCFPDARKPRVVWVGIGGEVGRLARLQEELERATAGFGKPPEKREFRPHLTLGRPKGREVRSLRDLGRELQTVKAERFGDWMVQDVALVRSELQAGGPRYTDLAVFPLSGM